MSVIAIKKSAWDNASVRDRTIFRYAAKRLGLGVPATYKAGTTIWYVFADTRFTLKDLAYLGTLVKGIATNTTYELPMTNGELDKIQLRKDVVNWVKTRVVWPVTIIEGDDPHMTVLATQNAPNALKAGDSVPSTWTPVDSDA